MKHMSTIVNAILAVMLILILLTTGLPTIHARAAEPANSVPTATAEPSQDPQVSCDPDRSIHVSGTAVVNVLPDRALIQLGVQSNGRTPKEAQARNAKMISKVVRAVKNMGVESKDISTDRYVIEPIYIPYDSLNIDGYRIYNIISITVRDVDQVSDVIATAFEAGANEVVNVEFYTSELRKYRDQAREMAMKAASEKASALSKAVGADTDCVLNISENSWSYFNGYNRWHGSNNQNAWTQNAVQNAVPTGGEMPSDEDNPVSAGHISIRAEVSVTFALR